MASLASLACTAIRCSTSRKRHDPNKQLEELSTLKIKEVAAARSVPYKEKLSVTDRKYRQNIPTKLQLVDAFRQGVIIQEELCYRQTIVIRSFEVGPDENMTMESILNLLQDTAINHSWMTGRCGDGTGATHDMMRDNLIWVVTRMHVQVDCYPIGQGYVLDMRFLTSGEVIDIETWVGATGRICIRREWLIKSHSTGHIYARATSKWVMMNKQTRRLSKIPEHVKAAEVLPWFSEKRAFEDYTQERIGKLDKNPTRLASSFKPRWCDLDMNQHVNNVKYARWMLEAIPDKFFENHQLCDIIIEYKRECGCTNVVQSLCEPQEDGIVDIEFQHDTNCNRPNGFSVPSPIVEGNGQQEQLHWRPCSSYTHLLRTEGESNDEEIARGRTKWKTREP